MLLIARWGPPASLLAVIALALTINVWDLSENGFGNLYYSAAARSMTESWRNFFFVAFDSGGFISVDKPPVFLWIDGVAVRLFGFSSLSVLLPTAIAGAAGVGVTWFFVHRYFGVMAATIGAIVLLLTPIVVAINRVNQPEPFYVLALLGAAGCTLVSLERRRWWTWTLLAGILVGVAFNTKMLAGWIPGPAMALAIVVGVEGTWRTAWRQWLPRLAVLAVATLVASASWMLVVDGWPADDRPYVGGSSDNSVSNLVLGYNGFDRVEGDPVSATTPRPYLVNPPPANAADDNRGAGLLRMFDDDHGGQIAWLLPFALLGGGLSLWRWRDHRLQRSAVLLWLGWTLLFGVVFSLTEGTYHPYYTSALGPGVGALTGISVLTLSQLAVRHSGWLVVGGLIAILTLWLQLEISARQEDFYGWLRPLMAITVIAGLAVAAGFAWKRRRPLPIYAGLVIAIGGLLLMPAAWSLHETAHAAANPISPRAGPRQEGEVSPLRQPARESATLEMVAWLESRRDEDAIWDVVLSNARDASLLMVTYDLSVMPLGGFRGSDPTLTTAEFARLVASGKVRFVFVPNRLGRQDDASAAESGAPTAGVAAVFPAVQAVCEPASDLIAPIRVVERGIIYDCSGQAAELASR